MDSSQTPQEILNILDIRQSDNWSEYLRQFGWNNLKLKSDVNMAYMNAGIGRFAKIQRPHNLTIEDLAEIEDYAKKYKFSFVKVEPSIAQNLDNFEKAYRPSYGFMSPPSTLFIDLRKTQDELWKQFSHSAKYSINRANRERARVEIINFPSDEKLTEFYSVVAQTTARNKFSTISLPNLLGKNKIFKEKATLLLAYDKEGNLNGGKYFLGFNNCVWYMYGGTSSLGRKNKSGYKLVWESFLELKRQGFDWLDFEGLDDPRVSYSSKWGGFAHFKEKFGGLRAEFPFPRTKYYSKVFDLMSRLTKFEV